MPPSDASTMPMDFPEAADPQQLSSRQKRIPSFSLSSASSSDHSITSRKGRHAEPDVREVYAERASISMPPPYAPLNTKSRSPSIISYRRPSELSESYWVNTVSSSGAGSPRTESAIEDFETPRLTAGNRTMSDLHKHAPLPEAAMKSPSNTEHEPKRMSVSSVYSMNSARTPGVQSSAASVAGSDVGTRPTTGGR
jgi:hypothetical protein